MHCHICFAKKGTIYNVIIVLCADWQKRWRPSLVYANYTLHGFEILILIILTHYTCFYIHLFQSYDA